MPERPNILLIVSHDTGRHLGCYGEDWLRTPRLDALAAQGARCTHAYAAGAFCSPSRGAIITGNHPHVNGLMGLVNLGWNLPAGTITDAVRMRDAGYGTHLFGLQHEVKDVAQLGFDYAHEPERGRHCANVATLFEQSVGDMAQAGRPFYARVGFNQTHRPFHDEPFGDPTRAVVPAYLRDTPGAREDFAQFHGSLAAMDTAVGCMLDALGAAGAADNTLVVFTTDHGIPFPRAKGTMYDSGIGVSLIARWPGVIGEGMVIDDLISNVDIMPTLLGAAGVSFDADTFNGRTFLPALLGETHTPRDAVFAGKGTVFCDVKRCIRTARHKFVRNFHEGPRLHLATDLEISLTRRDMGNDHLAPRPAVELYDLEADPHEQRNLAGLDDVADVERDLSARLGEFQRATNDPAIAGGIARPAEEREIIASAYARLAERCTYSRDGLLSGFDFGTEAE